MSELKNNADIGIWKLYLFALKSPLTRENYQNRIEKFFDFVGMEGKSDIKKNSFKKDPFVLRVNSHLTIMMDNKSITIPSQIGIDMPLWKDHTLDKYGAPGMPMQGMVMPGMAPIYTTDNTGLIKVGSVVNRNYTLGEFFQIWGLDLDGKTGKATVDGKPVPDFKNIVLRDKENIVLYVKS